jgi:hypothetical protein
MWSREARLATLGLSPKFPVATHPMFMLHHHPPITTIRLVKIPPIHTVTA